MNTRIITYIIAAIFIAVAVTITTFVIINSENIIQRGTDFCEDRGYKYSYGNCYKIRGDTLIERKIGFIDGSVYWKESTGKAGVKK